jgi:PEP-CTERM motif
MRLRRLLSIAGFILGPILSAHATTIDTFTLTFNLPGPIVSSPNPAYYNFSQVSWTTQEPTFPIPGPPLGGPPGYSNILVIVPGADSFFPPPPGYPGFGPFGGLSFAINPAPGAPSFMFGWQDGQYISYNFTETGPSITQGTLADPTFAAGTYTFTSGNVDIIPEVSSLAPGLNELNINTAGDTLVITKEVIPDTPEPSSLILLGTGLLAACTRFRKRA